MAIKDLHHGDNGKAVSQWQMFLVKQDVSLDEFSQAGDGIFGPGTEHGTKEYQLSKGLNATGEVDPDTYAQALEDGFIDIMDANSYCLPTI